jgi:hypothetical protein
MMKLKITLLLLLCAFVARGATTATVTTVGVNASLNGSTITTGLSYPNPGGSPSGGGGGVNSVFYVGSTITITGSGCTSGSPCTWTLLDQNSDTVSTVSTTAQAGVITPLGQINCAGSAANTVCLYNAPPLYPSTQVVTINITDGTNAAQITVNFTYLDNLNEYWTHRGRFQFACVTASCATFGPINNIPWSTYALATSPVTYQPLLINFVDTFSSAVSGITQTAVPPDPNIDASIITFNNDWGEGVLMPDTAGSSINRPTRSFDGKWITFSDYNCIPGGCGSLFYSQQANGSALQLLASTCKPIGYAFTMDKNHPSWINTNDNSNIYVCDLNTQTRTSVATHTLNPAGGWPNCGFECPSPFSYNGGPTDSLYTLKTANFTSLSFTVTNTVLASDVATYTYSNASGAPVAGPFVTVTGTTNGSGVFNIAGGTLTITNTVSSGGTATYTYTGTPAPLVGAVMGIIYNTTNGSGAFNVSNATVTAVGSGTFSIALAGTVTSAADTGTAIYGYPVTAVNASAKTFTVAINSGNVSSATDTGTAAVSKCYPIVPACAPQITTFDLTNCYTTLASSCATQAGTWNANLGTINFGWDTGGDPHCVNTVTGDPGPNGTDACERGFHDMWFVPQTNTLSWLYGPGGAVGESIFFNGTISGGSVAAVSPNTVANMYIWGHPAFSAANPYLVSTNSQALCNASGPQTTPHTCTSTTNGGNFVFDLRFPTVTIAWQAATGTTIGHLAWDGYRIAYFGHDSGEGAGSDLIVMPGQNANGCYSETLSEENLATTTRTVLHNFGCQPLGTSAPTLIPSYDLSPVQSPDGTKLNYSMQPSQMYYLSSCAGGFLTGNQCGTLLGWEFFTHRPDPPVSVHLGSSSSALVSFTAAPMNRETQFYWVYKQVSCSGTWSRLSSVTAANWGTGVPGYTTAAYTYTDAALTTGLNACYGITSQEWSGQESNHLSNVIKIANASGTFTQTVEQGEGTVHFAPTGVSNVTGMAVTQYLTCATACAGVSTPSAPHSLIAGTGSLTGEYWYVVSYCKFLDFPADTNPNCTPVGNMGHVTLASQGAVLITPNLEMVGQDAVQIWAFGPSSTQPTASQMFLQTPTSCINLTTVQSTIFLNYNANAQGSYIDCTFGTYSSSGGPPPTSNTAIGGYKLTWTDAGGAGDRYDQIYYREGAAVALSGGELAAQPQLIATPPVGTQSWYDGFPNQAVSAANIHYAIVVKRMDGTRSAGVCMTGAGVSESCN